MEHVPFTIASPPRDGMLMIFDQKRSNLVW